VNTIIYYFTGTGNSLKISRDISKGIPNSRLRHIAAALAEGSGTTVVSEKVGIVFPVYVEGLPLIVERFARSLNINGDTYVFAVANYGESAGGSLLQLEDICAEKGSRLSSAFGLKMPDNTQILFPPSPVEEQRRDFDREAAAADDIARTVSQGSEAGLNLIQRIQRTPRSPWKRPAFDPGKMAENFSADEKCDGCAVCEEICPVRNIVMEGATPRWQNRCEQCLACMQWCPQQAIQFSKRTSEWGRYHHPDVSVTELLRRSCK